MPSVDDLLAGLASRGLYLANLFQYQLPGPSAPWRWQANLTDGQSVWEFGRGDSAPMAIMKALLATQKPAVRRALPTPPPVDLEPSAPAPAVNEDDLPF